MCQSSKNVGTCFHSVDAPAMLLALVPMAFIPLPAAKHIHAIALHKRSTIALNQVMQAVAM
jgi:hypothetical protein